MRNLPDAERSNFSNAIDAFLLTIEAMSGSLPRSDEERINGFHEQLMPIKKVIESMSSDDWSKMGVALGLLWYKFDSVVNELKGIRDDTRSISRNTTK